MPRTTPGRTAPLVLVIALATLAFAGCFDPQRDDADTPSEPAPEPEPTETERRLGAEPAETAVPDAPEGEPDLAEARPTYTKDDWFILSTPRAPEGHIRAFQFNVPAGAVTNPIAGTDFPMLFLEIVPIDDGLQAGQDWDLYGFHDDGGKLRVTFALYGATMQATNLTSDPPREELRLPQARGNTYVVAGEELSDGDTLYFVLVGYGASGGDMSFAMRIPEGAGPQPPPAAPDFATFSEDAPGRPIIPQRIYDGTGAYKAVYGEFLDPDGPSLRAWTDTVSHQIDEHAGEAGAVVRDVRIETTAPTGPGWTYAAVQHDAYGEAYAWTLEVAAQGTVGRANGVTAQGPLEATGAATDDTMGAPKAFYLADGDGASHTRLTLQGAQGDVRSATYVHHGWLSASIETITGVPSDHFEGLANGAAEGLPWLGELPP